MSRADRLSDPRYRAFYASLPADDPRHATAEELAAVPVGTNGHAPQRKPAKKAAKKSAWEARRQLPCAHLGAATGRQLPCGSCGQKGVTTPEYACDMHGTCTRDRVSKNGQKFCLACRDYLAPVPFTPRPGDPLCGVVVGCVWWPSVAEAQVRLIRRHCGPVPILICVDPTDPERDRGYLDLARHENVWVDIHTERLGHTRGDLRAFRDGLRWARGVGLDYLAKLSHRFWWDTPDWLDGEARLLRAAGLPASARRCTQNGKTRWPIRTEVMLLDVAQWDAEKLTKVGMNAEWSMARRLRETGAGTFRPWTALPVERNQRTRGILWHGVNTAAEYRAVALREGVLLDADFSCEASGAVKRPEVFVR